MFDSVTFDDIVMDGTTDAEGVEWCVVEIEGWWDTPPLEQVLHHPTGQDRSLVAANNLSGRPLVLRGTAALSCAADAELVEAVDRLAAKVWPALTPKPLQVIERGQARAVSVLPAGSFRKRHSGRNRYLFEVPLIAEDPRKYSASSHTAVLPGAVVNAGNFTSDPTITLTAGGNYTIKNATQGADASLILTGAPAGAVVDMRRRTVVSSGGADIYSSVVNPSSVWWTLMPGSNTITKTGGAASIAWRDAWL